MLVMGLVFALSALAQQKPLTQDQVQGLVRSGLGDESGAKLIGQRGIGFAPAEDFLQSLKAAGASEAFLAALRTAKQPQPASAKKPLNQVQIFALLAGQVTSPRVAMLVKERGIDFEPQQDYLDEVRLGGGDDALITALKSAKVTKPATVDPAAHARQAEVRQHVARGAELKQKGEYALAEQEYRAALLLDSQNADLYESLSYVLIQQKKWDDGTSAARQAVRLNPNNDLAHWSLAIALKNKGDWVGAVAEYREAVRLNPNNDLAHSYLGSALGNKGDWDGEIAEEREALRLNPKNEDAHVNLGIAIGNKGDVDGAMAEFREAVRLDPTDDSPHYNLGVALGGKGDRDGEIAEEREALRLNPKNELAHLSLGNALEKQGDLEGAVAEYRAGLRLNPNNDLAHSNLGIALGSKGDWDGAIAEEREALRLNPKNEDAHVTLGVALGHKGDLDGEIAEEREALRLNPNNDLAHANLGSALKSTGKPRVFVESWFAGGVFKAAREPDSTTEMTAFARSCPQSTVTIDDQSPDYTLKLSHVNDPRFHDGLSQIVNNQLHLIYGYTLFDHQGNMVSSQPVGASLTEAAQSACKAALSNWGAR
jgi:tetratricopeptide (TPR) repeat protein